MDEIVDGLLQVSSRWQRRRAERVYRRRYDPAVAGAAACRRHEFCAYFVNAVNDRQRRQRSSRERHDDDAERNDGDSKQQHKHAEDNYGQHDDGRDDYAENNDNNYSEVRADDSEDDYNCQARAEEGTCWPSLSGHAYPPDSQCEANFNAGRSRTPRARPAFVTIAAREEVKGQRSRSGCAGKNPGLQL